MYICDWEDMEMLQVICKQPNYVVSQSASWSSKKNKIQCLGRLKNIKYLVIVGVDLLNSWVFVEHAKSIIDQPPK